LEGEEMNNNPEIMTDDQYEFCKKQANLLAKIVMDLDVESLFGKDGNANFVLETIVILTAGTLVVLGKKIKIDPIDILRAFYSQVEHTIKAHEKKPFLTLVH
jgi:hypothetical protein